MVYRVLQTRLVNLSITIVIFALTPTALSYNFTIAKPNCDDACGDIRIPYPFGTTQDCYESRRFSLVCNKTFNPPKLFIMRGTTEVTHISLDGQIKLMQPVAHDCYNNGSRSNLFDESWTLEPVEFTVNRTANQFTIVGCDTYGSIDGWKPNGRYYTAGCSTRCFFKDRVKEGLCQGSGCCQVSIPENLWQIGYQLRSYNNYSSVRDFNDCGNAFLVEETEFRFYADNLTNLRNVKMLPMVADWAIQNETTCEQARMNSSTFACKSLNSTCYEPGNGYGYRCRCEEGYEGNSYLIGGCEDINECKAPGPKKCEYECVNTEGGFRCPCPEGLKGNGTKGGEGCKSVESPGQSRGESRGESLMLRLVAGTSLGVIALLLAACWLYLILKRRKSNKTKQMFFLQNGGMLLQQKLHGRERSPDMAKIFSSSDLHKATNDFHNSMIIGQGGYGTVYKGLLQDNRIVAIKKSKKVDPNQIDQFVNEVIVLSQINHRNVVKLLGCCLETEVPLLVYEFVTNGTLSAHLNDCTKARFLNWDTRLRIAAETAGVLWYLHSSASTPIIHRDVKTDNILLDHTFTAKVSDFGASRLVPIDHTELSTMVQGTFGYLDPEYMQTNQLTEKSDVYSFGVVLLELLTGRRAISFDKPENEKNLANFFLSVLKQERLFQILDDNIVGDGINREQIIEVAMIAQGCLHVRGEDRPSMKEVAMELERLIIGGRKHSWARNENNIEETELLLGHGTSHGFDNNGDDNSISVGYDSLRDQVVPMSGGR